MRRLFMVIFAGLIGLLIAPIVGPALARLARPAVKVGIGAGMSAYRTARVKVAELRETLEDILAETQNEQRGKDFTEL